jgi:hypothetical protein
MPEMTNAQVREAARRLALMFQKISSGTRSTLHGTKQEECKELEAKIAAVLLEYETPCTIESKRSVN